MLITTEIVASVWVGTELYKRYGSDATGLDGHSVLYDVFSYAQKKAADQSTQQVDPTLPKDPDALLDQNGWREVSNPKAKEAGHRTFENTKTGEKLRFDKGKPGQPGHEGLDHWHRENPNSQNGKNDQYLDAQGNPVPRGHHSSHLYSTED